MWLTMSGRWCNLRAVSVGLLCAVIATACAPTAAPAKPEAAAPAKAAAPAPAAAPGKAAEPAKPAAQPAKPAAQAAKPAAQPAKPAPSAEPDPALVEAAKKEGKLVWYTSIDLTQAKKVADAFEKKYGLRVEIVRDGAERLLSRLMKELGTGVNKADVFLASEIGAFLTLRSSGFLAPYRPKGIDAYVPELRAKLTDAKAIDPEGYWSIVVVTPWVMPYNTEKVKAADAPKGWKDLLDPKWKDKLVHPHPSYSGVTLMAVYVLRDVLGFGEAYYRQLAKNEPMIVQSALDVPAKVVGGERQVGAGMSGYHGIRLRGNPIATVLPADGAPLTYQVVAVIKSAANPNAAKLFAEFAVTPDALQPLANDGYHPARSDVKLPEGQIPLDTLIKMKLVFPDAVALDKAREGVQKMFKEVFGV